MDQARIPPISNPPQAAPREHSQQSQELASILKELRQIRIVATFFFGAALILIVAWGVSALSSRMEQAEKSRVRELLRQGGGSGLTFEEERQLRTR